MRADVAVVALLAVGQVNCAASGPARTQVEPQHCVGAPHRVHLRHADAFPLRRGRYVISIEAAHTRTQIECERTLQALTCSDEGAVATVDTAACDLLLAPQVTAARIRVFDGAPAPLADRTFAFPADASCTAAAPTLTVGDAARPTGAFAR